MAQRIASQKCNFMSTLEKSVNEIRKVQKMAFAIHWSQKKNFVAITNGHKKCQRQNDSQILKIDEKNINFNKKQSYFQKLPFSIHFVSTDDAFVQND